MTPPTDVDAVLVSGVYGAGKSSVVADIGAVLQSRGERFGLLDVDWLGWFDAGGDASLHDRVLHANVRSVSSAYVGQGVRRLALARSIKDQAQLDAIRSAVPAPVRVVRLEVTATLVEQRLSADPTEERRGDDLRVAMEWLEAGHGVKLEDLLLSGDRPIRETSEAICSWLGWI